MVRCDNCDSDVSEVWRNRDLGEPMARRDVRWFCRHCHPEVDTPAQPISPGGGVPAD